MSAFAIKAREEILLGEKVNDVLVTGATGGVGSLAVMALTKIRLQCYCSYRKRFKSQII